MRIRTLRLRTLMVGIGLAALLTAAGVRWFRGNQYGFNLVVSRAVPKGAALADLEAIAGRAILPPPSDRLGTGMQRMVVANPGRYPDGWQEGDFWACYDFPDGNRWWFQVRRGRLVNYDPSVLAGQPQAGRPAMIR